MKRILLASTAIVGLAGAAAAEISFSGSAELEYNTGGTIGTTTIQEGFDWDLEIDVTLSQTLDNGLEAGATFGFEVADGDNLGQNLESKDFVLFLESETSGLYFGDTSMAAETIWSAAGDMEADDFSEQDDEVVLRGEGEFGAVDFAVSYIVEQDDLNQLSLGMSADLGSVTAILAYQEEETVAITGQNTAADDFDGDEVIGLALQTTLGGADFEFAYASNQTEDADSIGLEVSYPIGDAVTLGAYYVSESVGDDNYGVSLDYSDGPVTLGVFFRQEQAVEDYGFDLDYDLGGGIVLFAGFASGDGSDDGYYAGGSLDLGGGAELRLITVDADNVDGDNEYFGDDDPLGTTLTLSFTF